MRIWNLEFRKNGLRKRVILRNGRLKVVGIGGTLRKGSTSLGALRGALVGTEAVGAELLGLRELGLLFYEPGRAIEEYGPEALTLRASA